MKKPECKPVCKLIGEDGNVFNLIGRSKMVLRREGSKEALESFNTEIADIMQKGGSYDDVLNTIMKYVDVV